MKRLAVATILTTVAMGLSACGSSPAATTTAETKAPETTATSETTEGSTAEAGGNYKFGFICSTTGEEFSVGEINRVKESMNAHGLNGDDLVVSSFNNDVTKQVDSIENIVASGCNAAILYSAQIEACEDAVKAVEEAGVRIISCAGQSEYASVYADTDQYDVGKNIADMAADYIEETYGADSDIEVALYLYTQSPALLKRGTGMEDELLSRCPNVQIVQRYECGNTEDGMSYAESLMQTNPDVKVLVCINDGGGMGAVEAFSAAGKDDVAVFGADATEQGLASIKAGGLFKGTCTYTAVDFVPYLMDLADGKEVEKELMSGVIQVTAANVDDYIN